MSAIILLTLIGIVFVYSAGTYWGKVHYGNTAPFLFKQLIYLGVAVGAFYVVSNSSLLRMEKSWTILYIFSLLLLIAVLIPGIGAVRNGSQSWIAFDSLVFSPLNLLRLHCL